MKASARSPRPRPTGCSSPSSPPPSRTAWSAATRAGSRAPETGESPERPLLTVAEVNSLADACGHRYRAMILLACFGGLRWGELLFVGRAAEEAFRWATESDVGELASEAYAVRVLDSLRSSGLAAIRKHDGTQLL